MKPSAISDSPCFVADEDVALRLPGRQIEEPERRIGTIPARRPCFVVEVQASEINGDVWLKHQVPELRGVLQLVGPVWRGERCPLASDAEGAAIVDGAVAREASVVQYLLSGTPVRDVIEMSRSALSLERVIPTRSALRGESASPTDARSEVRKTLRSP
jgi:hypothetical protein